MISVLPTYLKPERVEIICPLGIRFVDPATNTIVGDGLSVEAYPVQNSERRVSAVPNRSGVWAFHGLPGLRGFEYGTDDEQRWAPELPKRSFTIETVDALGRFLPCTFEADAPVRVLSASNEFPSPPSFTFRNVPLFSSPARPVPGSLAVVRAQIFKGEDNTPAAWTLVEVGTSVLGRTVTAQGVADTEGRLVLIFPYPEPTNVSVGSPVGSGPQLLSQQSWPLTFRAWHTFDPQPSDFLDLDRVLGLQARHPDALWDDGSPLFPFTAADLIFGRELVVPIRPPGDSRPRKLFITPGASPS
jgi:hypothetical protein